jgi:molecular chaperone HtpG
MPADQKAIYYVGRRQSRGGKASPHIEALKKRGCEVLLMTTRSTNGSSTRCASSTARTSSSAREGRARPARDRGREAGEGDAAEGARAVAERVQKALDAHVKTVRITDRLTDSPACLVNDEHGMSARQERVLREAGHDVPEQKRILELNAEHPVVRKLQTLADETQFADWSALLYDQALLAEGAMPPDPAAFSKRVAP